MSDLDDLLAQLHAVPTHAGLAALDAPVMAGLARRREALEARRGLALASAIAICVGTVANFRAEHTGDGQPTAWRTRYRAFASAGGLMGKLSRYLLVAAVAFAASLAAIWLSQSLAHRSHPDGGALHALMHEQLDLDAAQQAKIAMLERQFADRRKSLDARLRNANAALARAMTNEHQYGPKVAAAVDQSHMAMGELQKATLSHVFAMREVLRPDQAARFDAAVAKALTRPDDG